MDALIIELEYATASPLGEKQVRMIIKDDNKSSEAPSYEVVDIIESSDVNVLKGFLIEHHTEKFDDLDLTWDLALSNIRQGI